MTEIPAGLPPAAEVVEAVRAARAEAGTAKQAAARVTAALRAFGPGLDELADTDAAAAWLGVKRDSIYRERTRELADGSPSWPAPDLTAGRSAMWTYRTLALHRAAMPGQGSAGRGRPRRSG
jgi:hypothetical protein